MRPLTREQIENTRKGLLADAAWSQSQHEDHWSDERINALCDMALRALPQEQIDKAAGEAVAMVVMNAPRIAGVCGRLPNGEVFSETFNKESEPEVMMLKPLEVGTMLYAAPAALPKEHWPDDFDCGMKHAYKVASVHSGLPQALAAIKAEIDSDSLHPEKRECPECGRITDVEAAALPEGYVPRLVHALKLALEYWSHRQQRYKNRHPVWVIEANAVLDDIAAAQGERKP